MLSKFTILTLLLSASFERVPWLSVPETHAAGGDIGIWIDQNGGLTATTAFVNLPFEGSGNEERNDGIYTYNSSTDDVTLGEDGNYLVLGHIRYYNNSNNRVNWLSRIALNGDPVGGTYGAAFVRDNNNREGFIRSAGLILNASAGDEVSLQWRRDSDAGTNGTVAGSSSLTIVKLPDDGDAEYGHYGTPTDSTFAGQTWTDLDGLDVIRETNTSSIELQAGGSDIRLKNADTTYLIIYGIPFHHNDATRSQRIGRAVIGSTPIPQSSSYTYLRTSVDEFGSLHSMFLYRTSSSDEDLSIQAQRGNADVDGADEMWNGTGFPGVFVMELPASAEVFISEDGTGAQDVTAEGVLLDLNLMRTVVYNDSSSFTKEGAGHETMQVEQDMDMLVTASCLLERVGSTSTTRLSRGARFEIEGTDQERSVHGTYLRGNQGNADTYNGALNPAGVFTVSADDSVQVEVFDTGQNGTSDETIGGSCGFGALNIDTLFDAGESDSGSGNDFFYFFD